ncbi:MAG: right-handed parallel beta-helix repeat-containing protein [Fischerella sp.]|nr:right-handed parallel beta-helix repeat-containing protein [Fischerella sp.]
MGKFASPLKIAIVKYINPHYKNQNLFMNRRIFLTYVGLGSAISSLPLMISNDSSSSTYKKPSKMRHSQAENVPTNFVNVKQFGSLVSGITNDPNIIAANTATIQTAINAVGKNGGGNIYIPAGVYQVAPPDLTIENPSSIAINYDNITLFGDGIGKTIIQSRGDWSVINGKAIRGHGILIEGTLNAPPRKNVAIKNLELSGGTTGFTGNRGFPADPVTGDGWDITHKGIVLDFDKSLDNITIDSVYVHDFRGELIYGGGIWIGKVTISNTKLHSSNASMLSIFAELAVTNCEFSQTANAWVEYAPVSPNKTVYFDQCIFKDSIANGFVVAQGNLPAEQKQIVTNCSFYNSPSGICAFGGASNFIVKNNRFVDCDNALFTSGENHGIEFYGNEIKGETRPVTTAYIWSKLSKVYIKKNRQKCASGLRKIPCIFYYGDLQDIVIEENWFENCCTPEQAAPLTNERPLFRNNQYVNAERRDSQGSANLWYQPPYFLEPKCEEIMVVNNTDNLVIEVGMKTNYYVDEQEVLITGDRDNRQVKFPQNSNTIQCQSDRYVSGKGEKLRLRFRKSENKWYEVSYSAT